MAQWCSLISVILVAGTLLHNEVSGVRPVRNGFYKIESAVDSSVLTATWDGRPRAVVTDQWREMSTQEWRVRPVDGGPEEIIRNENVKNNEVAKDANLAHVHWTFVPIENAENTFSLRRSDGNCLQNNGSGKRISFEACNSDSKDQQWYFGFLFRSK